MGFLFLTAEALYLLGDSPVKDLNCADKCALLLYPILKDISFRFSSPYSNSSFTFSMFWLIMNF